MITGEIIKTFQVNLIQFDGLMKKDLGDQFRIFSTKLHEDLGNVKYIFSDKTGTLTKNEMIFRACTIFSKTFGEIEEENNNNNIEEVNLKKENEKEKEKLHKKSILSNSFNKYLIQHAIKEGGIINISDIEKSPIENMGEACKEFFFNITLNHNVLVELNDEKDIELEKEKEIEDNLKNNKENLVLSSGKKKRSINQMAESKNNTARPILDRFKFDERKKDEDHDNDNDQEQIQNGKKKKI